MTEYNLLLGDLFGGPWASRGGPLEGAAGKGDLWEASGYVVRRLWERLGRLRPIIYIPKRCRRKRGKSKKERLHRSKCFFRRSSMAKCTPVLTRIYVFKETTFFDTTPFSASSCKMCTSPHAVCSFLKIDRNRVENVYIEM